jgi:adenylate kinase
MIRERLAADDAQRGFILDGFPRTLVQARALDAMLAEMGKPLDSVVLLEVDYAELARRISGRRSCQDCGKVFNVFTSPAPEGELCPKTNEPHRLFQRSDDNEAAVAERLRVYDEKTKPLVDFYSHQGLLRSIEAKGEVDEITQRLNAVLHVPAAPAAAPAPRRAPARRRRRAAHRPAGLASTARGARRRVVKKKVAAKVEAPKKVAAKAVAKKPGAKKSVPKAPAKKSVGAKSASRKTAGRKTTAKKSAGRKSAAKKSARRGAARKSVARKPAAKKTARRGKVAKRASKR